MVIREAMAAIPSLPRYVAALAFVGLSAVGCTVVTTNDNADRGPDAANIDTEEAGARSDAAADRDDGGADAPDAASCQTSGPGLTDCSPGGSGAESCCTSLQVPGGTYSRTYSNDGGAPAGETDPATISGFRLDKYLVTVGRFRQYVNYLVAGGSPPADGSGKHTHLNGGQGLLNSGSDAGVNYETGWDATDWNQYIPAGPDAGATWNKDLTHVAPYVVWTASVGSNEHLPINDLNWFQAYAFCIWDGGFLPSDAELGYATAGGDQQREYPWGATDPGYDYHFSVYGDGPNGDCDYPGPGLQRCTYNAGATTSISNEGPVGASTLGVGRWGQFDLDGNLVQWALDWDAPYVSPCSDCAYLSPTTGRVSRGAAFFGGDGEASQRAGRTPTDTPEAFGFRCARTP
jgi:formylglycine-generating enzyme